MPQSQTLGAGKVLFGKFPTPDFTNNVMMRYLGNTPSLSVAKSEETLDHYNADSGLRRKDISIATSQDQTLTIECDNIDADNLALWFEGAKTSIAQVSATGTSQTIAARRGQYIQLGIDSTMLSGVRNVTNVVVTGGNGVKASGTATFGANPTVGDTITINGSVGVFVNTLSTGFQILIGTTPTLTATNLRDAINARPSLGVNATASTTVVTITALAGGLGGNAITLAKSGTNPTLSGATLAGGTAGSVVASVGNYTADLARGQVFILADSLVIADGDYITVTYDQPAATREVVIPAGATAFGRLFYQADNGYGPNRDHTWPMVKLTPNGDYNIKTDNAWVTLSFTAEVLAPPTGPNVIIG